MTALDVRALAPWWGEGDPPWVRWPKASLVLEADEIDGEWWSPCRRYYFDPLAAARPAAFMRKYLRHTTGRGWAGKALDVAPWQDLLLVRPLFGWLRADNGLRRFRRAFVFVPKKNGKSTLASGLGLYLMAGDGEPTSTVIVAAGDEEQAGLVAEDARKMALGSPKLLAHAGVAVTANAITQERTGSSLRAVSSKAATKHGANIQALIFDELHNQKSRELYETLKRGIAAREQPVVLVITTAGANRQSICFEEYGYAKNVRDGIFVDDEVLPVVFETDEESEDWTQPETWARSNPSLGSAKKFDYMTAECRAAMNEPRKRNDFLRLELNVWTEAHSVWISPESWDECRAPAKDEELAPLDAVIGFDLSTRVDLTAVVVTFRRPDLDDAEPVKLEVTDDSVPARVAPRKELLIDFAVDVLPYFFMPKGVLEERVKKDQIPYDLWRDEGWLRVTEGDVTDTREVYRFVMQDLRVRFPNVREIAYDDWHAQDIASNLIADGAVAVPVRQGFRSLSAPSMLLEALVRSKRLRHDGNPVMRWCVSNCQVATDPAGNIKPVKPGADARSTRRIDGVVATVTALNRLMVLPRAMRYEGNGVQWIDL